MNEANDPGAVGKIAGAISAGWGKITSAVEKSVDKKNQQQEAVKKTRGDHFAAGHGMPADHLAVLVGGAIEMAKLEHAHAQAMAGIQQGQVQERFTAVDAASKPGKSISMSAAGDIKISESHPPAAKEPKAPKESASEASMPNKPKKMRGASRGNRGGRTY
jgi:hypothetical protein